MAKDYSFDFVKVCPTMIGRIITVGHIAFSPRKNDYVKKRMEIKALSAELRQPTNNRINRVFYEEYLESFKIT